jgi:hypothetical protein
MSSNRFDESHLIVPDTTPPQSAFMLFSVPPAGAAPASSMQWLYQRMYEEALKANQPKTRDLFAVMN